MEAIAVQQKGSLHSLSILVVDGHAETLLGYSSYLVSLGYTMIAAACMAEALATLPDTHFDVLITELRLPDGDGCQLLQRLQASKSIYAIAVTSLGMASDRERSRLAGFKHHLLKPFQLKDFEAVLEEAAQALAEIEDGNE